MISPDYFSFRWSWYRPILNRQERPADRCAVEVRRLPIRMAGEDAAEYIPYAVHPGVERAISGSLERLQDYAVRYVVRGGKISGHKLPNMDKKVRSMVAYLRKQNPHLSRDLLHHWCADPKGATALLQVCEVLWEQGWKQDQADAAPWVPAVNVLLLKLIRQAIADLSDEHLETTSHVLLCVIGGLYAWALQRFLKRYLEGVVEVTRIASYESMMLPATPMAFLQHQPDVSLLGDDRRVIRAYGLEPEIVPRMRQLRSKVGMHNEGGMLRLLAKDKLGTHLQRRTWVRLSLWKLAMDSGFGSWMSYVMNAKRLDQLLSGQIKLDGAALDNLQGNHQAHPVAKWLLAHLKGAGKAAGEPWMQDNITLMAFRVFDEDVNVEMARRQAETAWLDRKASLADKGKTTKGSPGSASPGSTRPNIGLRTVRGLPDGQQVETDALLQQAWKDGDLVLIQPDVTRALHSGQALSQRQGCLKIEWSEYLARLHGLHGGEAGNFISKTFLPGLLATVESREGLFLDNCCASGCLLRGSVLVLTECGVALRRQLRQWLLESYEQHGSDREDVVMPALSMCMDMTGEWTFSEMGDTRRGQHRIAFSLAVAQVDAGVCRDANVEQMISARHARHGIKPIGGIQMESVKTAEGQFVQLMHNAGFALTAAAATELTSVLTHKASIQSLRLGTAQVKGVLDGYQLPPGGLNLLVIQRHGSDEPPWIVMKAGKFDLAGVEMDMFELLDADTQATQRIVEHGLMRWR